MPATSEARQTKDTGFIQTIGKDGSSDITYGRGRYAKTLRNTLLPALDLSPECRPSVSALYSWMIKYESVSYEMTRLGNNPISPKLESFFKNFSNRFAKVSGSPEHRKRLIQKCFVQTSQAYAIGSMPLLHREPEGAGDTSLLLITHFMHPLLHLSDQNARAGGQSLVAAYNCMTSQIRFRIFSVKTGKLIRPFDMAALLTHELGHLLLDKYYNYDPRLFEPKQFIMMDETLALMRGGIAQLTVGMGSRTEGKYRNSIIDDFNFYGRTGDLSSLVRGASAYSGTGVALNSLDQILFWLFRNNFISKDDVYPHLKNLFDRTSNYYFLEGYRPKWLPKSEAALSLTWQDFFPSERYSYVTISSTSNHLNSRNDGSACLPKQNEPGETCFTASDLIDKLKSPSESCQYFEKLAGSDQLLGYIGAPAGGEGVKGNSKPGGEGVKGNSKPGGEGVKGQTRPGGEGVKGNSKPAILIRACLMPPKGF